MPVVRKQEGVVNCEEFYCHAHDATPNERCKCSSIATKHATPYISTESRSTSCTGNENWPAKGCCSDNKIIQLGYMKRRYMIGLVTQYDPFVPDNKSSEDNKNQRVRDERRKNRWQYFRNTDHRLQQSPGPAVRNIGSCSITGESWPGRARLNRKYIS